MKPDDSRIKVQVEVNGIDEAVSKAEQIEKAIKAAISLADELAAACRKLRIEAD